MSFIDTLLRNGLARQVDAAIAELDAARTPAAKAVAREKLELLRDELALVKRQPPLSLEKAATAPDAPVPPDATELALMDQHLRCEVLATNAALEAAQRVGGKTLESAVRDAAPVLSRLQAWRAGRQFVAAYAGASPIKSFRDLIAPPQAAA